MPTPLTTVTVKGRQYVLGRRTPPKTAPLFRFSPLLAATVPTPPATLAALTDPARKSVFMNDQLGCCVIAGQYHFLGNITAAAGVCYNAPDSVIVADYGAVGGYIPGDPFSDQGCNISDAMAYYASTGYGNGTKNAGYFQLDPTNTQALKQIIWLCGGINFGASMPNAWVNQDMPQADGFVWDVAGSPNDGNGHDFEGVGYTDQGVLIDTWGMVGTLTWAAIAKYIVSSAGGELWARICPAMINPTTNLGPAGFGWSDAITYFDALGGTIVVPPGPTPVPPTPVPPTPTPPVPPPTSVTVPFGVYNITLSGTIVNPAPPAIVVPDPVIVTLTVGTQQVSLNLAAALATK